MKKIQVKIGWEILLVVYGIFFMITYQNLIAPKPGALIVSSLYFLFVTISIFGISYKIENETLIVQNGIFGKTKIAVANIYKLEKTWNAISAPAPSVFGRVEIYYNNNSIVISPKNFNKLKDELLRINPAIVIKA